MTAKETAPQGQPVLSLRGIDKSFGAVQVLRGVDLDAYTGKVTALVGDNGAGKSTLIKGVLAANDGLGNAVISVLKKNKLNGKVPVTGQDATVQGLQNILAGDQCMTVYKAIKQEADAAAELAISLAKGENKTLAQSVKDPESNADVPSVLLTPRAIFKENVKDVVADGFVTKDQLCTGDFAKLCTDNGVS